MVSKKSKKKKNNLLNLVLGKNVAIFDWEWGRNSAPRDGQKRPCASGWALDTLVGMKQ